MTKTIQFNQAIETLIRDHIDIFIYEYPEIDTKTWNEYKTKPNCSCKGKVHAQLRQNILKFESIISKFMGEEVKITFPGPLAHPIIQEFPNLIAAQEFLKTLALNGNMIRNVNITPNNGTYIITVI
jgi:hypothetical protein